MSRETHETSYQRGFRHGRDDAINNKYSPEREGHEYRNGYNIGFNTELGYQDGLTGRATRKLKVPTYCLSHYDKGFTEGLVNYNGYQDGLNNRPRQIPHNPDHRASYERGYEEGLINYNGYQDGLNNRPHQNTLNSAHQLIYDRGYDRGQRERSDREYNNGSRDGDRDGKRGEHKPEKDNRDYLAGYEKKYKEAQYRKGQEDGYPTSLHDGEYKPARDNRDYKDGYRNGYDEGYQKRLQIAGDDKHAQHKNVSALDESLIDDKRFEHPPRWERITFSQKFAEGKESKSILLKLNRGEHLSERMYDDFLQKIKLINSGTKPNEIFPGFICFESIGKHTVEHEKFGSSNERLKPCFNFYGNFVDAELKDHIAKEIKSEISDYKFEGHGVGVSFKPHKSEKYNKLEGINLEIKFKPTFLGSFSKI